MKPEKLLENIVKVKNYIQLQPQLLNIFLRFFDIELDNSNSFYAYINPEKLVIYFNADKFNKQRYIKDIDMLSKHIVALLLLHEILHVYLKHGQRERNEYDHMLWNIACDCEINDLLYISLLNEKIGKLSFTKTIMMKFLKIGIFGSVLNKEIKDPNNYIENGDTAEIIYRKLLNEKNNLSDSLKSNIFSDFKLSGKTNNIESTDWSSLESKIDNLINKTEMILNNISLVGNESLLSKNFKKIRIKIEKNNDIYDKIKKRIKKFDSDIVSSLSTISWNNFNKKYMHIAYFPYHKKLGQLINKLYIVIDESGSMKEFDIINILNKIQYFIKKQIHIRRLRIIKHDYKALFIEDDNINYYHKEYNGGTSHKEAFELLLSEIQNNDIVLFITDLHSDIVSNYNKLNEIQTKANVFWLVNHNNYCNYTFQFLKNRGHDLIKIQ